MLGQIFSNLLVGVVIRGFQRPFRYSCNLRYLVVLHLLEIAHDVDVSLFRRKSGYRLLEQHLHLVPGKIWIVLNPESQLRGVVAERQQCVKVLLFQERDSLVCRNPVKPREYRTVATEIRQSLPNLDEHILQDVVSVIVVTYHPPHMPIQAFAVRPHQDVERLFPLSGAE